MRRVSELVRDLDFQSKGLDGLFSVVTKPHAKRVVVDLGNIVSTRAVRFNQRRYRNGGLRRGRIHVHDLIRVLTAALVMGRYRRVARVDEVVEKDLHLALIHSVEVYVAGPSWIVELASVLGFVIFLELAEPFYRVFVACILVIDDSVMRFAHRNEV